MDVLKNKNYESYTYTCRYATIPYSYHSLDDKYIYHVGSNLYKDTAYTEHEVQATDTLDSLALKYYNNPTFYWVIAMFNDISDVFEYLPDYFKVIKIPNIATIKFGDER